MDTLNNVLWVVLATAVLVGTYLSYRECKKYDDEINRQRKLKEKVIEENRRLRAERKALESRAETPAESREALRRVHATNDRVERGNRKGVPRGLPFCMCSSVGGPLHGYKR